MCLFREGPDYFTFQIVIWVETSWLPFNWKVKTATSDRMFSSVDPVAVFLKGYLTYVWVNTWKNICGTESYKA